MASGSMPPRCSTFMRRQQVAYDLGVTRHTLARLIKADPTFPKFFAITKGIEVIERRDLDRWIAQKKVAARGLQQGDATRSKKVPA